MNELYFKTALNESYFSLIAANKNCLVPFLIQVKYKVKKSHGNDFFEFTLLPIQRVPDVNKKCSG